MQDLKLRTKKFALAVINLYVRLPKNSVTQVLGKQVLRSATSVGAQYYEGSRAKSKADLISKFEGVLQELEETKYWLELLEEAGVVKSEIIAPLHKEASELCAIFTTSVKNLKS